MATPPVRRLDANGDIMLGRGLSSYLRGKDATLQRVRSRLRLFYGEWFVDTGKGVPWTVPEDAEVQPILGVRPNRSYLEASVAEAALGSEGVASIESLDVQIDSTARSADIVVEAITDEGAALTIEDSIP